MAIERPDRASVEAVSISASRDMDASIAAFRSSLQELVISAQGATLAALQKRLDIQDGVLLSTRRNAQVLRTVGDVFAREIKKAGYAELNAAFVAEFHGSALPHFDRLVKVIGGKTPFAPVEFGARDLNLFADLQVTTKVVLDDVVRSIAQQAAQKALLSVGGMSFTNLTVILSKLFNKTVSQAVNAASTALPTYYRVVADEGFQILERRSRAVAHYTYDGVEDNRNRVFCAKILEADRAYTRAEIAEMDNGMGTSVMVFCGGYQCRHLWSLWFDAH